LSATSTLVEPLSEKKTYSSGSGVISTSARASVSAGSWVQSGEDDLVEGLGLPGDGYLDAWLRMAVGDDPPGGDGVDDPAAVGGKNCCAFAALDQRDLFAQSVLGEGVPDGDFPVIVSKSAKSKFSANFWCSIFASIGSIQGRRPRRLTLPSRAIVASLSSFASPMKAMPRIVILRAPERLDREQAVVDCAERGAGAEDGGELPTREYVGEQYGVVQRDEHAACAFDDKRAIGIG
jgi:hypothetical protein